MKKVLVAVLVMLFWCNVVQAKIILSKCYNTKYEYESEDKPENRQKNFDDKAWEDKSYEIDLKNKIVNRVTIKSEEVFKKNIKKVKEKKGWIGIHMQQVTKEMAEVEKLNRPRGALIVKVVKLSPSEKAGIIVGDIILEFDKKPIYQPSDIQKIVRMKWKAGKIVEVKVWRNKKEIIKKIKVGDYYKDDPGNKEEMARLLKRYHVTNLKITKIEKDTIIASSNFQSGDGKFELTLDTKKNTTKSKLFLKKENVPWLVIEEKCE